VDEDALDKCVAIAKHTTDHLNHTYPKFPPPRNCTHPKVGPGTESFNRTVYSDLPNNTMVSRSGPEACRRTAPEPCPHKKSLLVGRYRRSALKCGMNGKTCQPLSERDADSFAIFPGDFFMVVKWPSNAAWSHPLARQKVMKCRKDGVGPCTHVLTGGFRTVIIPKSDTSFYLLNRTAVYDCDLEPLLRCKFRFGTEHPNNAFAVDPQDGQFLLGQKKLLSKCTRDGKTCVTVASDLRLLWEVKVDIDGDYLLVDNWNKRVWKCPRPPLKGCHVILNGRSPWSVIPQKESYIVSLQTVGVFKCPRTKPTTCTKLNSASSPFGLALDC